MENKLSAGSLAFVVVKTPRHSASACVGKVVQIVDGCEELCFNHVVVNTPLKPSQFFSINSIYYVLLATKP